MKLPLVALLLIGITACATDQTPPAAQDDSTAEVAKPRTLANVQEGFDRGKGKLIAAYNSQAKYNPVIGKARDVELVVRLTIDESGAVTDCAVVSDTANDTTFEAAMLDAIRKVHFPPHPGPPFTMERYPITFHPM